MSLENAAPEDLYEGGCSFLVKDKECDMFPDYEMAITCFRIAAKKGFIPAQKRLAELYLNGTGVRQNLNAAITWMRKAAEQDDIKAQANLGILYSRLGTKQGDLQAVAWTRKAANNGSAAAQNNLGEFYLYGVGINRDLNEALKHFASAAAQGLEHFPKM